MRSFDNWKGNHGIPASSRFTASPSPIRFDELSRQPSAGGTASVPGFKLSPLSIVNNESPEFRPPAVLPAEGGAVLAAEGGSP